MEGLTMSLDDYAKKQSQEQFSQRRRIRRGNNNFKQNSRYQQQVFINIQKNSFEKKGNRWEHDRYNDDFGGYQINQNRAQFQAHDSNHTILKITNLHFSVLQNELREMFEVYGELIKCEINWDSLGRSEGTAVVQYSSPESARQAIEEYNGVELDGLTLGVEYGTRELLIKKRNNNLITKNKTFKKFGKPTFRKQMYEEYEQNQ